MIRHLFRLVWNRRRASALILLEILVSFLVVFTVATFGLYFRDNYGRPLGFAYEDVWHVSIVVNDSGYHSVAGQNETSARLFRDIAGLPEVERAAGITLPPFSLSQPLPFAFQGRSLMAEYEDVTQGFAEVLGLRVVAGRWFQPGDESLGWRPVVIDQDLALDAFGRQDPVGQVLFERHPRSGEPETMRVIGVVSDYRKGGELSGKSGFLFGLMPEVPRLRPHHGLVVKVRPGTPVSFEKELMERLQRAAPGWSFQVTPLTQLREAAIRNHLAPLVLGGVLAFFLLAMVALGMVGVLWQNLLRRTREFGLRRAAGASGPQVGRQIVMEQLFLSGLGLALGTVLLLHLPLFDLLGFLSLEVFAAGLLTALAAMLLLTLACALCPSWLTSRIPPAEALRHE